MLAGAWGRGGGREVGLSLFFSSSSAQYVRCVYVAGAERAG